MLGFFPLMIDQIAEQVTVNHFPGDVSTITSAAAAMDHILSAIRASGLDNGVLSAARAETQRAIEAGYGSEGSGRLTAL